MQRKQLCPSAMHIRNLNMKVVCDLLKKQKDSLISFAEFLLWSDEVISQSIDNSTTFDVYTYFVRSCGLEPKSDSTIDIPPVSAMPPSESEQIPYVLDVKEISLTNYSDTRMHFPYHTN